ncbi:MAG TPA: sigma-70 family RNA polymerase sigma factor, partial [Acidobacteriota bacterium]|nr:sigma-70 family RNA polymerase sigma factor [Acidobacteriota bacterium]
MAAGDEAAYRDFYHAYVDRLSRYLLVVSSGDEHAMREALQATLQRVVRHIRAFDDEVVFWSWLTVLARSAFVDETRKRNRYRSFLERFALHAETETAIDPADAESRLSVSLQIGLAALADDERALLTAKYIERRTVRELAEQFET